MGSKGIHLLLLHHCRICGTCHWHQHSFIFTVYACLCYLESPLDHRHGFGWTFCKFFPTWQSSAGGDDIQHFLVLQVTLHLSQCTGIFLYTFLLPIYYRPTKLTLTWALLFIIPGYMVLVVDTNILLSSFYACPCHWESLLDHHHGIGWTFSKFFLTW